MKELHNYHHYYSYQRGHISVYKDTQNVVHKIVGCVPQFIWAFVCVYKIFLLIGHWKKDKKNEREALRSSYVFTQVRAHLYTLLFYFNVNKRSLLLPKIKTKMNSTKRVTSFPK